MKISKIHRVPDIIPDQISEWSCGGFMLFNFDEEGNPQFYYKVEDERNAMSLQYLVSHWADAMEDMNIYSETHVEQTNINISSGQRFYELPQQMVKMVDIRVKGHNNNQDSYRSIPRLMNEPKIKDSDGI